MMKDLTFQRSTGGIGRGQLNWIDKQLPICPFCHKSEPLWEIAIERGMGLNRYHFQCSGCGGIASTTTTIVRGHGLRSAKTVTYATANNAFRIECVGGSRSTIEVGHFFTPEELRKLAEV